MLLKQATNWSHISPLCSTLSICSIAPRREPGWSEVTSSSSKRPAAKLNPPPHRDFPASQNLSRLHGARPAHDQVGHPPSVPDRGEPAGQEEPAGALRQLHAHPDLPAPHLHHRPAEQLRSSRQSENHQATRGTGWDVHFLSQPDPFWQLEHGAQINPLSLSLSSCWSLFSINIFTSSFIWHHQKGQMVEKECVMFLYQNQVINNRIDLFKYKFLYLGVFPVSLHIRGICSTLTSPFTLIAFTLKKIK